MIIKFYRYIVEIFEVVSGEIVLIFDALHSEIGMKNKPGEPLCPVIGELPG